MYILAIGFKTPTRGFFSIL
jgi:hypothetical protein